MTRLLRFGLPLAVLVAVVSAAAPLVSSWRDSTVIPISRVQRSDFVHHVDAEGVLVAEMATVLSAPRRAGRGLRIAWLAPDGSRVEEGEVVVRFDATEMEKELFHGKADRSKAEQRRTQKEVEEATALENLERDADIAELQLDYAKKFQTKDEEIYSRREIIESEIDRTLATQRRDQASGIRAIRRELGEVAIDLLELEKRRAELAIERAEAGLQELEIRAPHAGIFVLRRDWGEARRVGDVAFPGMPIAEIPQLDVMKAQVFVLEADAGGVRPGVAAKVILEAHPGTVYDAEVRTVAALAKRRTRYSPVQYFDVELALPRTDREKMKPGQRIRTTLLLHDLEDVLTVPREAIFEAGGGGKVVYCQNGGEFERVEVELGPITLGRVVIASGVSEGDVIALLDPTLAEIRPDEPELPATGPQAPGSSR